jgi:hypothetical protein
LNYFLGAGFENFLLAYVVKDFIKFEVPGFFLVVDYAFFVTLGDIDGDKLKFN